MARLHTSALVGAVLTAILLVLPTAGAQEFKETFDRSRCTFTTVGDNPYYPLRPGTIWVIEGDEEDDGEVVTLRQRITVTNDTRVIDGVLTRVVEEYETEDGELVEISYNFVASCRETGDVWYFGEDVEDYEDGELVGSEGAWRAGVNGATPGILMPGAPVVGSRYFEEYAPNDEALDRAEIKSMGGNLSVPLGSYTDTLTTEESTPLEPDDLAEKVYAKGVGILKDETLELIGLTRPSCTADATTHCLANGRFEVKADWTDADDNEGDGQAIAATDLTGEFWFFEPQNTELIVKIIDACDVPSFGTYWLFAGGLTDVEVTIEIFDTVTGLQVEYDNDLGVPFAPIRDFDTLDVCD